VDVQSLGVDFLVFTGHKLFGPNGIGVLYGKNHLLKAMPPYQTGGGMIERVSVEQTTFRSAPERFEAGTPAIADAIGLGAAIDYLETWESQALFDYEQSLLDYATKGLKQVKGISLFGQAPHKMPIISFNLGGVHPHDVATYLDHAGICVRAGHHCTQPLMQHLCVPATLRASFAFYNTFEEIDYFVNALHSAVDFFKP
jgi:cysteine desulfurase/selenocysteine lyase